MDTQFPRGLKKHDDEVVIESEATSHWTDGKEIEGDIASGLLRYDAEDGKIWLGRNLTGEEAPCGIRDDRHIVTIAGSRSGKGRSGIIPNLCEYRGSVICIDPKGENLQATAVRRGFGNKDIEGLEQDVRVLDPFNIGDAPKEYRTGFNPISLIKDDNDEAIEIAALIADSLIIKGSDKDRHWDESARAWIQAVILLVAFHECFENRRDLVTVKYVIDGTVGIYPDSDEPVHKQLELTMADMLTTNVGAAIAGIFQTYQRMGVDEFGSVQSTVSRNLQFLDSKAIQENLIGENEWSLDELKTLPEGMTLYLTLPVRYMNTHSRWLRMIITLMITQMEKVTQEPATGHPVLAILDEANVLGHLKTVETSAGYMAGYGLQLWTIWQDLGQLKRHYKETWETFLGNAGALVFFANTDLTTLEHVSKRLGRTEILTANQSTGYNESRAIRDASAADKVRKTDSISRSSGAGMTSESNTEGRTVTQSFIRKTASLMNPDEIARYFCREGGLQIVFLSGRQPIALQRTPYDQDHFFENKFQSRK